jgi:hypothetical protein
VESLHGTVMWIGRDLYNKLRDDTQLVGEMLGILAHDVEVNGVSLEAFRSRRRLLGQYRDAIIRERLEPAKVSDDQAKLANASVQLFKCDARIEEMDEWISWYEKYPRTDTPGLLPQTDAEDVLLEQRTGHPDVKSEKDARASRERVSSKIAKDFVDELQKPGD